MTSDEFLNKLTGPTRKKWKETKTVNDRLGLSVHLIFQGLSTAEMKEAAELCYQDYALSSYVTAFAELTVKGFVL